MQPRYLILVSMVGVLFLSRSAASAPRTVEELPDAHQIVADNIVQLLPLALQQMLDTESLRGRATAGRATHGDGESLPGRFVDHYLLMDVTATEQTRAQRRMAAEAFPHEESEARNIFQKIGVRNGGNLPWMVETRYRALVAAFEAQDRQAVVREVGHLIHFATDVALPFNTTTMRYGAGANELASPSNARSDAHRWHRTTRVRCEASLVRRMRAQLDYEVRVWPPRAKPVMNVRKAVFETLLESHRAAEILSSVDRELLDRLSIRDTAAFDSASDLYYTELATRIGSVVEARLETGLALAAGLIAGAWVEAGSPASERFPVSKVSGPAPPNGTTPDIQSTHAFVGSRNSTVFHRDQCAHARRIGAANLVGFSTAKDAIDAGRTACRACKPTPP